MTIQFSALSNYVIGFMMQVTEYKYSVPILRYDPRVTGCSMCPHALFLQARSQIVN